MQNKKLHCGQPLTQNMIDEIPVADIHVHVPGTISPETAWQLGVKNNFIQLEGTTWRHSKRSLAVDDPHEHYTDIFRQDTLHDLNTNGIPKNLQYSIEQGNFKSFDRVMATVQGHRYPPGGIQNEMDYQLVLQNYLQACLRQKIIYTELQQNIRIAYQLYPDIPAKNAREKFYLLLKKSQMEFLTEGVYVNFLHCFNKTSLANDGKTPYQRAIEGAEWLREAQELTPDVFTGIESAGHEKDQSGWPSQLREGYEKAKAAGFGCEAHGGEGIGVEHMLDVVHTLPITRLAHGLQAIEDLNAIMELKQRKITLVMSPSINIALGSPIHKKMAFLRQ